MSETMQPSLFRRLRDTPWRDLLRGRLSGRLNWSDRIEAANLSGPAKELIRRVVTKTRLWRSEKVDVVDELVAHFADGIDAGQSIERLIEKFGDEKLAVKLIRRAKVRNRPAAWRATAVMVRLIELVFVIQLALAAYFFSGRTTIKNVYVDALNEPTLRMPIDQRGWPLYLRAKIAVSDFNPPQDPSDRCDCAIHPGGKYWPWMTNWLHQHSGALATIRAAAAKPVLGYLYGAHGSINDAPNEGWNAAKKSDIPLIHLGTEWMGVRQIEQLMYYINIDSDLALEDKDGSRFVADVFAVLGMADQMGDLGFVTGHNRAAQWRMNAIWRIDDALSTHAALFRDGDLQGIAHRLSELDRVADKLNIRAERLVFCDLLQRMYTDDGHGDGRVTPDGIQYAGLAYYGYLADRGLAFFIDPAWMLTSDSRAQALRQYDQLSELAAEDYRSSSREVPNSIAYQRWRAANGSPRSENRHSAVNLMMGNMAYSVGWQFGISERFSVEIMLGYKDGVVVGLALEMYRRQHGRYPDSLSELVPELLPRVPIDRMTGEAVKYRFVGGKPVVYSSGRKEMIASGEWILYPQEKNGN